MSRRVGALSILLLVCGLPASPALAHMGSTKYLFVALAEDGATVDADVEVVDAAYELGLSEPRDERALLARDLEVRRWLSTRISVHSSRGTCRVTTGQSSVRDRDGKRFVSVRLAFACPSGGTRLVLRDDAVFDDDPQHESIVRLATTGGAAAIVLRTGHRELVIDDAPHAVTETIGPFILEGALHLATGYDHLLFLLSLLLVAGELSVRDGIRKTLRDVAVVVTGFTLGHSITLIAAALDLVVLPPRLVESGIAASIVAVAGWNLYRPAARRGLPYVAVAFGLVHGFGFSAVLRELVLPRAGRVVALLSFNLGIELAQLAFVALILGPLAWLARRPDFYRRWVVRGGSAIIAAIASYWLVTRALGL